MVFWKLVMVKISTDWLMLTTNIHDGNRCIVQIVLNRLTP